MLFDQKEFIKIEQQLTQLIAEEESLDEVYSLEYLSNLSDGDVDFISQSIRIFIETVHERILIIKERLEQKDYEGIAELAHNIKPSFEMIQNTSGSVICDYLAHNAQPQEIPQKVEALSLEYDRVEAKLKQDFPQLQSLT